MAVKKRTTLRSKSSKRVGSTSLPLNNSTSNTTNNDNKKDKILDKIIEKSINNKSTIIKSNSIINNNNNLSDPKQPGISKSAIRRRKRKLRDQLTPKLTEDLLDALTESTNTIINTNKDGIEEIIINEKVKLDHTPNPKNKRGEMALFKIENKKFKEVLKSKELRQGGLSALRNSILANISRSEE
ncbi:ribosome biogenesis protein slx9 [Pichia californica]|uniref:Ribosome biogenesis protein SLX9 n=1 Tax=Pichia californica TaxID=460514 RepID=A0A9P6WLR3_9ASCO|nr:ribosome biogenesis protein slx9 [[Candida] californica]KAG0688378.1 ribosome biogenesis protein slx9 [[Candida] californica]